jgi:AbiJ N-terminal domain 4
MGIYETFSKRMKRLSKQGQEEVYQYDTLPREFRVQVIHIWGDALGFSSSHGNWKFIHDTLARERGVFYLGNSDEPHWKQCQDFFLAADKNGALDIIELSFRVVDRVVRERYGDEQKADHAITELNHRFREHGIGYQFDGGELVRMDSQYLHAEAVKPAIALLNDAGFQGPSEEFLKAHEHHRKGDSKEAINWALKSFESTMKAICDARRWPYDKKATAKPLLDVLFEKELIPKELQSHFTAMRSTLQSGLPTLRNTSTSSHGQGATPTSVPDYMAAYALHLAATNIVFLIEAHKARKRK